MSDPSVSTFNAAPSMLGYLFQVRVALLWAIRQSRAGDFAVSVEALDDVSFSVDGDPVAVLQTKHSIHATAGLGDQEPTSQRGTAPAQWVAANNRDKGLRMRTSQRPLLDRALTAGHARR